MTHWPEPTKQPYDWTNPIEIPQLRSKTVTQPRCDLCRFWELQTVAPNGRGYCNRFPPSIDSNDNWQWTEVDADEWCGEFQPKDTTNQEEPGGPVVSTIVYTDAKHGGLPTPDQIIHQYPLTAPTTPV
jgi:hypothetical protein